MLPLETQLFMEQFTESVLRPIITATIGSEDELLEVLRCMKGKIDQAPAMVTSHTMMCWSKCSCASKALPR